MSDFESWFAARGWQVFDFQREVWDSMMRRESGLLHSSTGSGKTLAVFLGALLSSSQKPGNPRILWITPLRALAADTEAALAGPLADLLPSWKTGRRTGDLTSTQRKSQLQKTPEVLVITPESLCLLLSQPQFLPKLTGLETVIVDEWHEFLGSKRGVLLELVLARLRAMNPTMTSWALSATLGNVPLAAECFAGYEENGSLSPVKIHRGHIRKTVTMETILPPEDQRIPWSGHLGLALAPRVAEVIAGSRTCIVFTNTRSQAELWHQALASLLPEGTLALHHGSIDRTLRGEAELGLKKGKLRAVVATSSLDLGVDFAPVETVFQVGSPKGVARLLQRAGRSGHSPGQPSKIFCVPGNALEFVEIAAARDLAAAGRIEPRNPITRSVDVLTQHLLTVTAGIPQCEETLFNEVRRTHAFRDLSREDWDWVVEFAAHGGHALKAYPEFHRLVRTEGMLKMISPECARRHRMTIGTIASAASVEIKLARGKSLGSVEESFIARLKPGETFLFAGRLLKLERVRDMQAVVRPATRASRNTPQWMGGKMPLSSELADGVRAKLQEAARGIYSSPEMKRIERLLEIQRTQSALPGFDQLLVEVIETREGHHMFFYPFEGRAVHQGLAALLACRFARTNPASFTFAINDYGLELLSNKPVLDRSGELPTGLFGLENLASDILESLNAAELAKRQFREIARVAGLTFEGFPGKRKSTRQLQMSGGLLFDVFRKYDPGNRFLRLAEEEVLEQQLHSSRLAAALERMQKSEILMCFPEIPTPLAFPILADRLRESLSSEELATRIALMETSLEHGLPRRT